MIDTYESTFQKQEHSISYLLILNFHIPDHGVYRPSHKYMGTCRLRRMWYGYVGLNEENINYSCKIKYERLIHLPYSKTNTF